MGNDGALKSYPAQTARRVADLDAYFSASVAASGVLTCATGAQCRASHDGDFLESQLHHVGSRYDLTLGGKSLRIVVVGQEYGHKPRFVSLTARHEMIADEFGVVRRFKAEGDTKARNPHMKGCTSLLRLILGLGLGADHDGEFLIVGGERVHIFECFALVNFLLCSAVPASSDARFITTRVGGSHGRSTRTMQTNCSGHFRAALRILEPTLVVAQGYGVRRWIARAYDLPARRPQDGVEQVEIGGAMATLVSFTHPSARGALNWGLNERMPYLLNTVAPTIARVCG